MICSEGLLNINSSTTNYEFHLKDHLGNTRVAVNETNDITQENNYYPFGLTFATSGSSTNKYLYNGKEKQEETEWLAYGNCFYDDYIGRFFNQDRFAEKYVEMSPYQYAANNPIYYVDVNGDSLAVSGIQTAVDKFEKIVNTGLGKNYNTNISDDGVISIIATGKKEEMTKEQKEFLNIMNKVTTSNGVIKIGLTESDENVLIGSFKLESIDVDDISKFPTTGPSTAAGTLSHELEEQFSKQIDGKSYATSYYIKGLGAEDKVNCSVRGSTQSTTRVSQNTNGQITGNIDVKFVKENTISIVSYHITNNNITKVEVK
jgi:RHS repeat-associated protein